MSLSQSEFSTQVSAKTLLVGRLAKILQNALLENWPIGNVLLFPPAQAFIARDLPGVLVLPVHGWGTEGVRAECARSYAAL